jgi:4-hydroxy-tetrahydrodipicolinate synthase
VLLARVDTTSDGEPAPDRGRPAILAAIPTPFGDDGRVAHDVLAAHVELLARNGADGVFAAGTTGEGALLSHDEIVELTAAAVRAAQGRCAVVAHVGRPGTAATIDLARRAVDAGAAAVAAVVPYYYALTQVQVVRHFAALGEAGLDVPVFAYTIPKRAVNAIEPASVPRLADAGIAGLKDSTGSLERHVEYVEAARPHDGFRLLTGTDGHLLAALDAGSGGCVTAVTAADPALTVGLRDAQRRGDRELAGRLQQRVTEAKDAMELLGPSPAGIKRAVAAMLAQADIDYPTRMRAPLG